MTSTDREQLKKVIKNFISNGEITDIFKEHITDSDKSYCFVHFSSPSNVSIKYNRLDDICISFVKHSIVHSKKFNRLTEKNITPFVFDVIDDDEADNFDDEENGDHQDEDDINDYNEP